MYLLWVCCCVLYYPCICIYKSLEVGSSVDLSRWRETQCLRTCKRGGIWYTSTRVHVFTFIYMCMYIPLMLSCECLCMLYALYTITDTPGNAMFRKRYCHVSFPKNTYILYTIHSHNNTKKIYIRKSVAQVYQERAVYSVCAQYKLMFKSLSIHCMRDLWGLARRGEQKCTPLQAAGNDL